MNILNEEFQKTKSFETLSKLLKIKRTKRQSLITYNDFEEILKLFITDAMSTLLKINDLKNDVISCEIKKLPNYKNGIYSLESKKQENSKIFIHNITINEDIVKKIYFGNILELTTIFHELSHFKINLEIRKDIISFDLLRIVKEKLLDSTSTPNYFRSRSYYKDNYKYESEEKIANFESINLLKQFTNIIELPLTQYELLELKNQELKNREEYYNYNRDLRNCLEFNNNTLDFEEAFDFIIKDNKEWISQDPKLQIEYYLDERGEVAKRTREELLELQERTADESVSQCIEKIINKKKKDTISQKFKVKKIHYNKTIYKISNNNKFYY